MKKTGVREGGRMAEGWWEEPWSYILEKKHQNQNIILST